MTARIPSTHNPPALVSQLGQKLRTLPDILWKRADRNPGDPALWALAEDEHADNDPADYDPRWRPISWGDYREEAARIAAGLKELGLQPGDCVGILAPTSWRWDCVQMGVLAARGVVVGLDPHDRADSLNAIAQTCALSGLIFADEGQPERFSPPIREGWRFTLNLKRGAGGPHPTLDQLLATAPPPSEQQPEARSDDPATIIFTSGTTGAPKGIAYNHRQFLVAISAILEAFPDIDHSYRLACWLPLSNLFQRMINLCAIAVGAQTYYVDNPSEIMSHLESIAPHIFIGVPRFYEKLNDGITEQLASAPPWQRGLIEWALRQGYESARAQRQERKLTPTVRLGHAIADRLVLRRIRTVLGPNLRFLVSGSAPMPRWLLERFHAMGLLVLEAYGMSENIVPVAMNRPDAYRFGTVGRTLSANKVRLAPDNELLFSGEGVFHGYLGDSDDSASSSHSDSQGYLASGDYASIDQDGFITLTGRKSDIFKTSTGRRIAPAGIEAVLRQLPYVEHAAVFGVGRPFLVALLVVNASAWQARLPGREATAQCACLAQDLAPRLSILADYGRPAGLLASSRPLSIERGELTANLKLRRYQIEAHLAEPLARLYDQLTKGQATCSTMRWEEEDLLLCALNHG